MIIFKVPGDLIQGFSKVLEPGTPKGKDKENFSKDPLKMITDVKYMFTTICTLIEVCLLYKCF